MTSIWGIKAKGHLEKSGFTVYEIIPTSLGNISSPTIYIYIYIYMENNGKPTVVWGPFLLFQTPVKGSPR